MSENKPVDVTKTVIYHEDEPALPPPTLEVGLPAWLRQNLFGSPADIVITILSSLVIVVLVTSFFNWATRSANWFAIINNQRLFMMESFERAFEWRIAITVLLSALLTGVSFAAWVRRDSLRTLTMIALGILALVVALPSLIEAAVAQPPSYLTAGNVDITDRASTLNPQKELAFIAQAGETVSLRLATDELADIEALSRLAGFSDRASNALANAARNRLEQQETTGAVFDRMVSRELTEALEERTRLQIRTFVRTNDMPASTKDFVRHAGERLTGNNGSLAELRVWLNRLEDAAKALDTEDEAVILALEAVEDAAAGLSVEGGLTAAVRQTMDSLTQTVLASEQIEDLGESLITQLSEDLIGAAGENDDEEELIQPSPAETDFLREMFVRLLTPPSVIDIYRLGQTPMRVTIYDAQMQQVLAAGVVSADGETVAVEIPSDGWYVLSKNAVEGEEGTAILAVHGIFPIVQRTLSATESVYVRLTDSELEITGDRPQIDGANIPFAVLIDNQFRGLRGLPVYLTHFIPLFFRQIEALLLPFFITLAWGFVLGRALAHLLGENTVFNSPSSRAMVLAWAMSPCLILLAYFALPAGGAAAGMMAVILKLAAAFGVAVLVNRIDGWLNRANRGEDAEASITKLLMYGWGIYPLVMFVLTSGVGGLSGAALGSMAGGLVWLLLMYFIGLNFKGNAGYGLLVAGFFLQIAQAFVVNIVWDGWTDAAVGSILIWLLLAVIGLGLGLLGTSLKDRMDSVSRRLGYLISCGAFVFVLSNANLLGQPDDAAVLALAGLAFFLWFGWMFFTGVHRWTSNRIMIGLLLLTFLWMQTWTALDRWSIIYFILWLIAGAIVFRRGEKAQDAQPKALNKSGWLFHRFAMPGMFVTALAWLLVLFVIPTLVRGLESGGVLQTSPDDLLPLSDKRLWGGLMLTMQLTILGIVASFPIGLALALGRRSSLPVVKYACILYIEMVRGVPLITVLFMATLLVPLIDPTLATIENAVRAWVGITLFSAAYLAENVRGGLQSIARGQTEAAQAIGLSAWQTTLHILLPQALRAVIPALVGQFISLFKDTSLVFIVGLAEITGIAVRVVAQPEFLQKRQETFLYVAILYFVFSYIMSYISRRVEATGSGAARAHQI